MESANAWLTIDHSEFTASPNHKQMLKCMAEQYEMATPANIVRDLMFQPFYHRRTRYERFSQILNFIKPTKSQDPNDEFFKTLLANIKLSMIYQNYNLDTGSFRSIGE